LVGIQSITALLALRNYRQLPRAGSPIFGFSERVSIVVPARNEAERLPALLESLRCLEAEPLEVIVADDSSTDGTREIATSFGCKLVDVGPLPAGWTGKCRACHLGALEAKGDWLLFTDADTIHEPACLEAALSIGLSMNAGLTSLLARQVCSTVWERLLLPYAYAGYFAAAWAPNRPGGRAIANGQYMLFRRSAYWKVGGHGSVRNSLIEDVAIARTMRDRGETVVLCRGETVLRVRMYEDLRSLWEGFSKNVFRFVLAFPLAGTVTALSGVAIASAVPAALRSPRGLLPLALIAAPAAGLTPWLHLFRVPLRYALLHPVSATIFQVLAFDSIRRTLLSGQTVWRGRRY
jgi:chlorobactene glucosyltransferase